MKYLKTGVIGAVVGLVMSFGIVSSASALISLDTGTNSTDISLRDEQLVLQGFELAFDAYKVSFSSVLGTVNEAAVTERAQAVEAANATLQAKEFSPKLTPEFETSVAEFKATANSITKTVTETANKDYSNEANIATTQDELATAGESLDAAIKAVETSAAAYEALNPAWIIFLIGGLIVTFAIGITAIRATKNNKKLLANILGNDPNAAHLTKEQKKMIVRLYNDIVLYDESLAKNNTSVLQALEIGTYKQFTALANKEQYGPYAAFYFELDSLVKLRAQKVDEAQVSARRAVELRGPNTFVTSRARQLVEAVQR